ncbi:elongation factor 1 alpha-like protein, partial [Tremellales sp. Uapishka_1]
MTVVQQDLAGLHLDDGEELDDGEKEKYKERAGLGLKQEELLARVKKEEEESGKKGFSLIVVGHVDAGKSTLMGRLLYDLGELSEKEKTTNERGSKRAGKGSFAFAWGLDVLGDERDRGVTIDIATTHFQTPHRNVTLLDAPGHRDFIPAMISGAAQADVALLVVDGSPGEFEAGFERGGQTREHAWLVRSLGVKEIIVGINKMDMVEWSQDRYDDIVDALKPFLSSAGFSAAKTIFLPIAAMEGVNISRRDSPELKAWYKGPTLVDALDKVEIPMRPYEASLRIPVSNVFKGQTAIASGVAVSGRLCSGIVQVGDRVRAVPGDEVAMVRTIEVDDESAPYALAGQNVTLYLSGIDPIHLSIGTVLCPTSLPVPLVSQFTTQILVFDLQSPIIAGAAVELFHHSMNLPATISKLVSISEKGQIVKKNPRVLQKGVTATVEITLRSPSGSSKTPSIPLETAANNKEMSRILLRRSGETIAAGVVMEIIA